MTALLQRVGDSKVDLDIFFSGRCNMDCKYCYIPKSEYLARFNEQVIESLVSGKLIESLQKVSDPEVITSVGLWGAEPTINYKYVKPFFEQFFKKFTSIKRVDFSTNFLMGATPVIEMIKQLDECTALLPSGKLETVEVQISIDGPEWVTDKNRKEGATKVIVRGYKDFVDILSFEYKPANINTIEFNFKPTLNADNFREMVQEPHKIIEWFKFGDELFDYYLKRKAPHLLCKSPAHITIENPGDYSTEDGKVFAEWLKLVYSIDPRKAGIKHYRQPLFNQQIRSLEKVILHARVPYSMRMYGCSAGNAGITADTLNRIYPCHRAYALAHYTPPDKLSHRNRLFFQRLSGNLEDEVDAVKVLYQTNGYHNFPHFRIRYCKNAILSLAAIGQVDRIFAEDPNLLEIFALFVAINMCYVGYAVDKTTSINVPNLSFIRLFGNGAFQLLLKKALDKYLGEGNK